MRSGQLMRLLSSNPSRIKSNISNRVPDHLKSNPATAAAFEFIVAKAFSFLFKVPLVTSPNGYCIAWSGDVERFSCSASNGADIMCYLHGYHLWIEVTLSTNAHQASQEFSQALRHFDNAVSEGTIDNLEGFVILVAPVFHQDTFTQYHTIAQAGSRKVVLLSTRNLSKLLRLATQLSRLGINLIHQDVTSIIIDLHKKLKDAQTLISYEQDVSYTIAALRVEIMKKKYHQFLSIQSYRVLTQLWKKGRRHVGANEINLELKQNGEVNSYCDDIGKVFGVLEVTHAIERSGIASIVENNIHPEPLFIRLPISDISMNFENLVATLKSFER